MPQTRWDDDDETRDVSSVHDESRKGTEDGRSYNPSQISMPRAPVNAPTQRDSPDKRKEKEEKERARQEKEKKEQEKKRKAGRGIDTGMSYADVAHHQPGEGSVALNEAPEGETASANHDQVRQ